MGVYVERYKEVINGVDPIRLCGRVTKVIGLVIEAAGPSARIGEICLIRLPDGSEIRAEVVGFRENRVLLMPIGGMEGIGPGCEVIATSRPLTIKVGEGLRGRILDGIGNPIDGKGEIEASTEYSIINFPPDPLTRKRVTEPLSVGIRAIDSTLTFGKGQRMGIFSGSGVGKSTLMGMIARYTSATINVIGLIGERGREVREFIERDLGEEGLKRSVLVVATNDKPPLIRLRGAFVTITIAEYFRDKGYDVMLMMDSITRFARAQREVGLAIGEPPAQRGFTPSVFELLPKLLERSGNSDKGSITGIYTILVDADDMNEPIADNVRAILDGHIVLSRNLASRNHYPAIDVLESVSRCMIDIVSEQHEKSSRRLREVLAVIRDAQDLIDIGAYVKGSNPKIDYAITMISKVNEFLRQGIQERCDYESTISRLLEMFPEQ
ncbi:MAG: flagellar protein export ATPase FliI [bacterium]|nr:flagellar protein export ATPase FliI [bacterium]